MDLDLGAVVPSVLLALAIGLLWGRLVSLQAMRKGYCAITCRLCGVPLALAGTLMLLAAPGAANPLWRELAYSLIWAVFPAGFLCQRRVYPRLRFFEPPPQTIKPSATRLGGGSSPEAF